MSRSEERRKAREGESGVNKLYIVLGAVAVIAVGAIGYSVASKSLSAAVTAPVEVEGLDDMARLVELAQGITVGNEDAPVTIVEFADFQCPGCMNFATTVKPAVDLQLISSGRAKFVFYDFPLVQIHPNAFLAARSARCASDQGKFWEYHDHLFRTQIAWSTEQNPLGTFLDYGETLGLDADTFEACVNSDRHAEVVTANMHLGVELGVQGTPTILVNGAGGVRRVNNFDFESIQAVVDELTPGAEAPVVN